MNKRMLRFAVVSSLLGNFVLLGASGCAHEGPAERAGRHVDNAADDVKSGTKKAADDVKGD
jgi:hypothetical protein